MGTLDLIQQYVAFAREYNHVAITHARQGMDSTARYWRKHRDRYLNAARRVKFA